MTPDDDEDTATDDAAEEEAEGDSEGKPIALRYDGGLRLSCFPFGVGCPYGRLRVWGLPAWGYRNKRAGVRIPLPEGLPFSAMEHGNGGGEGGDGRRGAAPFPKGTDASWRAPSPPPLTVGLASSLPPTLRCGMASAHLARCEAARDENGEGVGVARLCCPRMVRVRLDCVMGATGVTVEDATAAACNKVIAACSTITEPHKRYNASVGVAQCGKGKNGSSGSEGGRGSGNGGETRVVVNGSAEGTPANGTGGGGGEGEVSGVGQEVVAGTRSSHPTCKEERITCERDRVESKEEEKEEIAEDDDEENEEVAEYIAYGVHGDDVVNTEPSDDGGSDVEASRGAASHRGGVASGASSGVPLFRSRRLPP